MDKDRREELEVRDLIDECLAVFEGGEIHEDFETPYANWMIADIVDTLYRFKRVIRQRQEGREMMQELSRISLDRLQKEFDKDRADAVLMSTEALYNSTKELLEKEKEEE